LAEKTNRLGMSPAPDQVATAEWAQSLVGRDWEIFWVDDEDNDGAALESTAVDATAAVDANESTRLEVSVSAAAPEAAPEPQEQQQPQHRALEDVEMHQAPPHDQLTTTTEPGQETAEETRLDQQVTTTTSESMETEPQTSQELDHMDAEDEEEEDESQGSIIDDWYDGHILGFERTSPCEQNVDEVHGFVFRIHFVGEETVYNVNLVPQKVRPSARGWVSRTVALLRPPPEAGEDSDSDPLSWESKLPADTRRLQDEATLKELEHRIFGESSAERQETGARRKPLKLTEKGQKEQSAIPTPEDFDRIRRLEFLLEAQILLRSKLAKIESVDGEDKFTDGVRTPTETYVNHLVQGCRDLIRACQWYAKAWRLLENYFGQGQSDTHVNEQSDFESLTFEGLMLECMEHGKDTIFNIAAINVDSCTSGGKKRLSVSQASTSRRNKRRRGQLSRGDLDVEEDELEDIATAASHLEKDMFSTRLADHFVAALQSNGSSWHIIFGNMFQGLSRFVVHPIVLWKGQVGLILKNPDYISLYSGRDDRETTAKGILHPEADEQGESQTKSSVETLEGDKAAAESAIDPSNAMSDDDMSTSDSEESNHPTFTYDAVQNCVAEIRSSPVLSRFNLFDDTHRLHALLHDIETVEKKARDLFSRLTENLLSPGEKEDEVLKHLKDLIDEIDCPTSPLDQIKQFSSPGSKDLAPVTRDDLVDAVAWREFLVGVERAKSFRERRSLVVSLYTKVEDDLLPSLEHAPCLAAYAQIAKCRDSAIETISRLYNDDRKHLSLSEKFENDLLS
ncbi:MAG: hypothetical protein SGILL_009648, partial [Bacillariaceae sp.]